MKVMQIIPETMFTVLHQIIEIQTHRIKEVMSSSWYVCSSVCVLVGANEIG